MNENKILYSATSLVNHIRNDCIIDYLEYTKNRNVKNNLLNYKITNYSPKKRKRSFDYIIEDGYKFEEDIFINIKNKMRQNIKKLCEIKEENFTERYKKTVKILLSKQYDIILGALLLNDENNTYGYPDMIVSGNWIHKYINEKIINILNDRSKYYIVDVKSSTISLISNGEHVSSGNLYDGYKLQIFVYMKALENIFKKAGMNNTCDYGFIMGKKYTFINNKQKIKINDPFERLAIIDYNHEQINCKYNFEEEIKKALLWKEDLELNYSKFSLDPINKDELYPNIKNKYDKGYKKIKEEIAYKNKEITYFYNCGIKNRLLAWKKGYKKYDDTELNAEILGFSEKSKKNKIINKMLNLLHEDRNLILEKKNNFMNWQKKSEYEFYVDFETYCGDYWDEYSQENYYENLNSQKIYMIGVGYINSSNNYEFKCFIIRYNSHDEIDDELLKKDNLNCNDYIFCDNELDLIIKFTNFINSFNKNIKKYYDKCRLIHWSSAEPILFNKKLKEYNLDLNEEYILPWYDLLKIFTYENYPIVIKENFSYGLKSVVKKLNEYKYLNLEWTDLDDGLLSSFIARDIYKNNVINKNEQMIDIVEYNYLDCLALNKILICLREYIIKN